MKKIIFILTISNVVALFMIAYTYQHAYLNGHESGISLAYLLQGRRNIEVSKAIHLRKSDRALQLVTENLADAVDALALRKDASDEERKIFSEISSYFLDETKGLTLSSAPAQSAEATRYLISVRQRVSSRQK